MRSHAGACIAQARQAACKEKEGSRGACWGRVGGGGGVDGEQHADCKSPARACLLPPHGLRHRSTLAKLLCKGSSHSQFSACMHPCRACTQIFISKEHEKGAYGENSPGPVTSQFVSAIGEQKLSVKKSAPSWGFGSGLRIKPYDTPTPGPGAYFA